MGKYLTLWEMDQTKVPISPQDRGTAWAAFMDIIKEDIKKGLIKDWGAFVGELRGYTVSEGTEVEIANMSQKYVPFVIFEVHPVMSVEQVDKVIKTLTK